jgi:hypothetical protein
MLAGVVYVDLAPVVGREPAGLGKAQIEDLLHPSHLVSAIVPATSSPPVRFTDANRSLRLDLQLVSSDAVSRQSAAGA